MDLERKGLKKLTPSEEAENFFWKRDTRPPRSSSGWGRPIGGATGSISRFNLSTGLAPVAGLSIRCRRSSERNHMISENFGFHGRSFGAPGLSKTWLWGRIWAAL